MHCFRYVRQTYIRYEGRAIPLYVEVKFNRKLLVMVKPQELLVTTADIL